MTRFPDTLFGPVSGEEMADWCELLNDDNLIHLSREAAEAAGFGPRRVNPGPAKLGCLLSASMAANPAADVTRIDARFLGNVLEGDTLVARDEGDTKALCRAGEVRPVVMGGSRGGKRCAQPGLAGDRQVSRRGRDIASYHGPSGRPRFPHHRRASRSRPVPTAGHTSAAASGTMKAPVSNCRAIPASAGPLCAGSQGSGPPVFRLSRTVLRSRSPSTRRR